MDSNRLRIAVPSKGRLSEHTVDLLKQAGLSFRRQDRSLFARVKQLPVDITFLRADDIPILCAEGAVDMGVTGLDLLEEAQVDLPVRLQLGFGHCRLALCVHESKNISLKDLDGKKVATSFPHVTDAFLKKHGITARMVELSGSVEIMISLGVADAIVDLIETGSTLAANSLVILEEIGSYETVLVQNPAANHNELADRVVRRLEGVVVARHWSMLEFNVPKARLAEAEKIAPGFNSPTVTSLEDPDMCAVQVMIQKNEIIEVMDKLEQIGATAILEITLSNCRL